MTMYLWVWILAAPAVAALVDVLTMKGGQTARTREAA
jgi:hypothetical protein